MRHPGLVMNVNPSDPAVAAHLPEGRRGRRLRVNLVLFLGGLFILVPAESALAAQGISATLPAASRTDSTKPPGSVTSLENQEEYLIAPDDVLSVNVVDVSQFSQDYRVSPDGTITLPLLSAPIEAEGLTPNQLASVIAAKLREAGLVSRPYVTVTVKASRVHSVAITGAVSKPQNYPLFGKTTLLNVLSQAGGLATDASDTAIITRGSTAMRALAFSGHAPAPGAGSTVPETVKVNVQKLLQTGDPSANVAIYPGDTVTVQRAGIVYVVGAVNRSGGFTLAGSWRDMTVLKAVAVAGNVTLTARKKDAVIIRSDAKAPQGRREIPVNLKKILAGRAPDQPLEANDILFVPDSSAKRALQHAIMAVMGAGTAGLIYRAPL